VPVPSRVCVARSHPRLPSADADYERGRRAAREVRERQKASGKGSGSRLPGTGVVAAGEGTGEYVDGFVQPDWTPPGITTPSARANHAMAYDPSLSAHVMFGGGNGTTTFGDTWTYCCAPFTWSQVTPGQGAQPVARYGAAMVYDGQTKNTLLIGGFSATGVALSDVWSFDGQTWSPVASLPAGRGYAGVSYDPVRERVYVFGGVGSAGLLPSTLAWNGTSWSTVTSTGPSARKGAAMAFDDRTGTMVLFGGIPASNVALSDTWQFNGTTWSQTTTTSAPPARAFMAHSYDAAAGQVVITGGTNSTSYYNDTWRFDGVTWTQAAGIRSPQGMAYTPMTAVPDEYGAMMFGGYNPTSGYFADQWLYSHRTPLITNELGTSTPSFLSGAVVPLRVSIRNPGFSAQPVTSVTHTLPAGLTPNSVTVTNADGTLCTTASSPSCTVSSTASGATVSFSSINLTGIGTGTDTRTFVVKAIAAAYANGLSQALSCFTTGPMSLVSNQSYYRDQVLADSPSAYYRLADTGATAANSAVGGVPGAYSGTVTRSVAGALAADPDTSVTFDGSSGSLVLPTMTNVASSTGVTLEAWVKPNTGTGSAGLIDLKSATGTSEIALSRWTSSHSLALTVVSATGSKSIIAQDGLQTDGWQHVAGTISSTGVMTLYRNGVPILTAPGFAPDNTTYTQNYVGRTAASPAYFSGSIDEAAVFPKALSQPSLTSHFQAGRLTASGTSAASLVAPVGATYAKEIRGERPIAYWRFDETSGNSVYDSSGVGNTGTLSGTVSKNQPGAIANDTDTSYTWPTPGAGAVMTVPDSHWVGQTGNMTFMAWVKPPTTPNTNLSILMKTNSAGTVYAPYGWYLAPNGQQKLALGNGTTNSTATSPTAIPLDGKWHQVAVVRSGTSIQFYLDGATQGAAQTLSNATANAATPLHVGGFPGGAFSFQGGLDEVAMYSKGLTAASIGEKYARGTGQPFYGMTTATTTTSSQSGQAGAGAPSGPLNNLPICGSNLSSVPLGLEPWWQYKDYPLGSQNTAHVNAADGNLTVLAQDSTVVGTRGRLAYAVQRSYNSLTSNTSPLPGAIGAGWQLNLNEVNGLGATDGAASLDVSNTIETVANAIPVTLVDRDGTRHRFTPTSLTAALNANRTDTGIEAVKSLVLDAQIRNVTGGRTLCVDQRYTPPAGVHVSLLRYIALADGVASCASRDGAAVVGYAAQRTDRMRYEFGPNGELLAVTDPAGVTFNYSYETTLTLPVSGKPLAALGKLRAVYEKDAPGCPSTYGAVAIGAACRGITLTYDQSPQTCLPGWSTDPGWDHSVCLTDPAGRNTAYDLNKRNQLIRVVNPDLSTVNYSYHSDTACADTAIAEFASANLLCAVTDSRSNTTSFDYTTPPTSLSYTIPNYLGTGQSKIVPLLGQYPIGTVTDRVGVHSFFAYSADAATTNVDTNPSTSSPTAAQCLAGTQPCQRTQFTGIDALGRVAKINQGSFTTNGGATWLSMIEDSWDGTNSTFCRGPKADASTDTTVDNNLCKHKVLSLTSVTPDEDTRYLYTPEGEPLRVSQHFDDLTSHDTTYGYRTQYVQATSTVCTDWAVAGGGDVTRTAGVDGGCATGSSPGIPISVLTDRTQSLTPRGNQATSHQQYLTRYQVDNDASDAPNTTGGATLCPDPGGRGTQNTGVVCEVDAPAAADAGTPASSACSPLTGGPSVVACTRYRYNDKGQKTSYTTPKSAAQPSGPGGSYTYTYYADGDRDASHSTHSSSSKDASGWLKAVTDPLGKSVLFAYDRAGNVFRSYDRDAVSSANLTVSGFSNTTTATGFTEAPHGPYPNAGSGANAASSPWRWQLSKSDQLGNRAVYCRDSNGNIRLTRLPNGTGGNAMDAASCATAIASPTGHDMTVTFDDLDRALSTTSPAEQDTGESSTQTYDAFGNVTSTTDPTGAVRTYAYDRANRKTTTSWTRGTHQSGQPKNQCAPLDSNGDPTITNTGHAPLPTGQILCQARQTFDGTGNVSSSTDATAFTDAPTLDNTTVHSYDALHRLTLTKTPRSHSTSNGNTTVVYAQTGATYDADSNVLVSCTPRDFDPSEGAITSCGTGTAYYGTTRQYDPAGNPTRADQYRAPAGTTDTSSPANLVTIRNCLYYDADRNNTHIQHPNAGSGACPSSATATNTSHRTVTEYNLLGRATKITGPRKDANGVNYFTTHAYSDSGDLTVTTNPRGYTTLQVYNQAHRRTDHITAADSATLSGLGAATGAKNNRIHQRYDANGSIIQQHSPNAYRAGATAAAHMISTVYDGSGRPIKQYVPRYDTRATTGAYASSSIGTGGSTGTDTQTGQCPVGPTLPSGYTAYPTDANSNNASNVGVCVSTVDYDPAGRPTRTHLATKTATKTGRYVDTTYSNDGLLASTDSPDPSSTTGGRVQTSTWYDGGGRPLRQIDASGQATNTTYTDDGLTDVTTPPGATSGATDKLGYRYDLNGERTETLNSTTDTVRSRTIRYSDGSVSDEITDPNPNGASNHVHSQTHYAYDYDGNPTAIFSPNATDAGGTPVTNTLFSSGDATTASSTLLAATLNTYTSDSLLLASSRPVDGANRRTSSYSYDPNGNKERVSTGMSGTPYNSANAGTLEFGYHENDRLETEESRGQGAPANTETGGLVITHGYDPDGNTVTRTQGSTGVTSTFYLDDSVRTVDDSSHTSGYAYDATGGPLTRLYTEDSSNTTTTTTTTRNDAGLQDHVTSSQFSNPWVYAYTAKGQPDKRTYGSQITDADYDADGQLTLLTTEVSGSPTSTWTYQYDKLNRVQQQQFAGLGAGGLVATQDTYQYDYDGADRVKSFTAGSGSPKLVTWDKNNNRTGYGAGAGGTCNPSAATCATYHADNSINQIQDANGTKTHTYDNAGRLCTDGSSLYNYDGFDRTTSLTPSTNSTCNTHTGTPDVSYTYDSHDRQTGHSEGTTSTTVSYDGTTSTIAREVSGTTPLDYQLDGDGGTALGSVVGSTKRLLQEDGRGNVSTINDATSPSTVTCTVRFDPFGTPQNPTNNDPQKACNTGAAATDVFYAGGRKDQFSNNYQFGARTYSPSKGAFIIPDTYRSAPSTSDGSLLSDPLTANTYTYVNGNPLNLIDPNGHAGVKYDDSGTVSPRLSPREQERLMRSLARMAARDAEQRDSVLLSIMSAENKWAIGRALANLIPAVVNGVIGAVEGAANIPMFVAEGYFNLGLFIYYGGEDEDLVSAPKLDLPEVPLVFNDDVSRQTAAITSGATSLVAPFGVLTKGRNASKVVDDVLDGGTPATGLPAAEDGALSITRPYARPGGATTAEQRASVQGRPCVDCGATADTQVADHIDPLVKEYYRTGSIDLERMRSLEAVQPQCPACSASQGGTLSWFSRGMRDFWGLG
jgi:RHS repeat-associated protein